MENSNLRSCLVGNSNDSGDSKGQFIQQVRISIQNVINVYRATPVIHRAKLDSLCSNLRNFSSTLTSHVNDNETVGPKETAQYKALLGLLQQLVDMCKSLGEDNWMNMFSDNNLDFVREFVKKFRDSFNQLVKELNIAKIPPCFGGNDQDIADDKRDTEVILSKLRTIMSSGRLQTNSARKLKIDELKDRLNKYEDAGIFSSRILSDEELIEGLSEFRKWRLDVKDLYFQNKLARGGYGDVFVGFQRSTEKMIAIKKIQRTDFTSYDFAMLKREIRISAEVDHKALLPFVGACLTPPFCICTEYMSGGSLYTRLHKDPIPLGPTKQTIIALGIAAGMAYLHGKNIIHRDIKSPNILLDADDYPKICDFGLSRVVTDDSTLTAGMGTPQWSAPEVLEEKPYNEKADVYSYGILLWELLTREHPYRGFSGLRLIDAVVTNQCRPTIPPGCPPKLAKLIKLCWDHSPSKRPSFETIVKAFQSGEMDFPGTNRIEVENYVRQILKTDIDAELAINDPVQAIESIISDLREGDIGSAMCQLVKMPEGKEWHDAILAKEEFMELFVDSVQKNPSYAFDFSKVVYSMITNDRLREEFMEYNGIDTFMDLFVKYGTTSMPHAIDVLRIIAKMYTAKHINRLSVFLLTSDMTLREKSVQLLTDIVEKHKYADDVSFNNVIKNILNELQKTDKTVLKAMLHLIRKLDEIPSAHLTLVSNSAASKISDLMTNQDTEIVKLSLDIFVQLESASFPLPDVVATFVNLFPALTRRGDEIHEKALRAIAVLLKSPKMYAEVISNTQFIPAFTKTLKNTSERVVFCGLKLLYAFLLNDTTFNSFVDFIPSILGFFSSDKYSICFIMASILTVVLQNTGFDRSLITDNVVSFITQGLQNNKLVIPVLKLAGIITSSIDGALFMEQHIGKFIPLIDSQDENVQSLAIIFFASYSLSNPICEQLVEVAPKIINLLEQGKHIHYGLMFLANICVQPAGLTICRENISLLIRQMGVASELDITLSILNRVTNHPANEQFINEGDVEHLITNTEHLWQSQYATQIFEIFGNLSLLSTASQVIAASKLIPFITDRLRTLDACSPLRIHLFQVIARTKRQM